MKRRKALSLLLSLTLLLSLALPATTAYAEEGSSNKGMEISKTATANKDGSYTITLEAYATGSKVISEVTEDVPTDIVLVLDQSGSMADGFSRTTEDSWMSYGKQTNSKNYDLRMNNSSWSAEENLYYKLSDGSYVGVSVGRTQNVVQDYVAWPYARNSGCYNSNYDLYADTEEGYKEVTVTRSGNNGNRRTYTYTYTLNDGTTVTRTSTGDNGTPPYTIYRLQDTYEYTYEYYYTINGVRTTIGEQSKGADTVFNVEFYKKVSAGTSITALEALQNAVRNFAGAVETKAAGKDGVLGTDDDINHRIAVVGFASGGSYEWTDYNYNNTEVFVGSEQFTYGSAAQGQYANAFQDMNTVTGVSNINASIGALAADGGTLTNLGLEMANGIFEKNPLKQNEKRNRVVIVFTDGVPGWSGYESATANAAITQAGTAKTTHGATVYTIGIFSGADATSAGNQNGNETQKANWFMQQVSSNNGTPQSPSYYLSAADAGSLNSIFQQISSNIETGGTSSTLTADAVVKDIISPQFTLPAGTTAENITVETYACTGKNANGDYEWSNNNSTMDATASITGDQVNVTGFNFSENYVGTVTENGNTTYRGNKLVISFKVQPKADFLGGNEVYTNTSAGIYENGSAENPLLTFDRPTVNVPIKDVTVTAKDKNVYLKGEVTADQLKDGAEISVGNVTLDLTKENYGLESWQTEYVDITVTVKDKDNNVISDKLEDLKEDTAYTVEVTVSPKNEGTSTAAKGDAATAKTGINDPAANIYVFKPELTFKDSTAYYGETVPTNNNYSSNRVGTEKWMHDGTEAVPNKMIGTKPTLDITYTPDESKLEGGKYTKQDVPVSATVKIGTENVNEHTTFVHQDCTTACGWENPATPGAPAFLIHIQTCTLNITKQGGAGDESYVFDVYKDGEKYSEVTVWGNSTETLVELPIGTYTISENAGWSWRYSANNGGSAALTAQNPTGSITCVNTKNNNQWLNGFSEVVRNIFGTNH